MPAWADPVGRKDALPGIKVAHGGVSPAVIVDGKIIQPQRELPLLHKTDVLVVGGGPAGVTAAIAAKRAGAEVALVERYGHFGGLWTGGLVVLVIGHFVTGKKQVCQGIGEKMLKRLDKLDRGIVNRRPGVNPTVDAEALKYVMVEMTVEAEIDIFLHCWGVDAIMEGNSVKGASLKANRAVRRSWRRTWSTRLVTATCLPRPAPNTTDASTGSVCRAVLGTSTKWTVPKPARRNHRVTWAKSRRSKASTGSTWVGLTRTVLTWSS